MKRDEIEEKYKWDLTKLFRSPKEAIASIDLINKLIEKIILLEGKILSTEATFEEFITLSEELDNKVSNLYVYAKQSYDVAPSDKQVQDLYAKAMDVISSVDTKLFFIKNELLDDKNIDKLKKYYNDEKYHDYKMFLESYLRLLPHTRSKEVEEVYSLTSAFGEGFATAKDTLKLKYPPVRVNGEEKFLNQATLQLFLENKDRNIRKEAYHNFYSKYEDFAAIYAATLDGDMKYYIFGSKVHNFSSSLERSIFNDNVPASLFEKVLDMCNNKHRGKLHRYYSIMKKLSNLDDFSTLDLNVSPVNDVDLHFSIEEGKELIYQALAPLGEQYIKDLKHFETDRWVDYLTHEGKRVGAYSFGTYESQPYIMMNWVGNLDSVYTLCHELGHSMHSYYSNKNNRALNANYKIFVAEVASITNEVLLTEYLLNKYKDDISVRKYLLNNMIKDIIGTMFRQAFFAEYERSLYAHIESGNTLTAEVIENLYLTQSKAYYGESVVLPEELKYQPYCIPHFYYHYYVYKYAIGEACALSIVSRLLKDNSSKQAYLKFLTLGGSAWPLEELKIAGVDVLDDQVYDDALVYFDSLITEFEKIMLK